MSDIRSYQKQNRLAALRTLQAHITNGCARLKLTYTVSLDETAEQVTAMIGDRSFITTTADINGSGMAGVAGIASAILEAARS